MRPSRRADGRLQWRVLRREPLVAIAPRARRADFANHLTLAEFASHPVIFREQLSVTQRLLEEELARHELRIEPVPLVEGREALIEAVAHGLGIGVIARPECDGDHRVAPLPLQDCRAEMVEALMRLADRPPSHLLDALFALRPIEA